MDRLPDRDADSDVQLHSDASRSANDEFQAAQLRLARAAKPLAPTLLARGTPLQPGQSCRLAHEYLAALLSSTRLARKATLSDRLSLQLARAPIAVVCRRQQPHKRREGRSSGRRRPTAWPRSTARNESPMDTPTAAPRHASPLAPLTSYHLPKPLLAHHLESTAYLHARLSGAGQRDVP
jgi:hypothetical protein